MRATTEKVMGSFCGSFRKTCRETCNASSFWFLAKYLDFLVFDHEKTIKKRQKHAMPFHGQSAFHALTFRM